jgi:hypothetical protein
MVRLTVSTSPFSSQGIPILLAAKLCQAGDYNARAFLKLHGNIMEAHQRNIKEVVAKVTWGRQSKQNPAAKFSGRDHVAKY